MSERPSGDPRILAPVARPSGLDTDPGQLEALVHTVHLHELFVTLRRHAWLILGVVATVVAVAGYLAFTAAPVYSGVAVIRLSDSRRVLTSGVVDGPTRGDQGASVDPLLSQVELLTSRAILGDVVDSMPMLRLRTRGFPSSVLGQVEVAVDAPADSFRLGFGEDSFVVGATSGERRVPYGRAVKFDGVGFAVRLRADAKQGLLQVVSRETAINRLIAGLRVTPRLRTDIVDVAYSSTDPYGAQQVVNRVVDVFRTASAEGAQRQSRLRREFLEAQLKVNDAVLADAREALTAFHRRERSYGSGASLARETGLPALELERQKLDAERRSYRGLLTSLQDGKDTSASRRALQASFAVPGVGASPTVTQLGAQLHQYETTRDSLASRSASHPDLPRLNLLISSTDARLLRAAQVGVQSSIAVLEGRIAAMDDLRARLAGSLQQLSATEAEEARLTERVENARKIADELRIEYEKARIAEAVTVGQVEIVDHAVLPARPVGMGRADRLALGLLFGLILGVGTAFVTEHLGNSIARRGQVEQLGLSLLGVVPRCSRDADEVKGASNADAIIEAFRGIRLNLMNAHGAVGPIVLAVTSPGSRDGKSFVSSNMALAFAYANHRTLLIDADLRRGALQRVLGLGRRPGLTDFLAGDASLEQSLQITSYPSLDFLPSGSRRRDAPELMGSARMTDLMAHLRSSYGVILLDTPPLGAGVDALALAMLAGNLLMVLRLGKTDRQLAEAKLEIMERLPIRLVGAVLNDVWDGSDYGAYSYHIDGYGYTSEPLFQPLIASRPGGKPSRVGGVRART